MRRAVFASEAGVGSAVMAHSLARARHPVSEGLVALLEPLLGTMIVCALGGLARERPAREVASILAFSQSLEQFPGTRTVLCPPTTGRLAGNGAKQLLPRI